MQKYKVYVTERQLNLIQSALDLFSRLLMGQINSSLWNLYISREIDHDAFERKCDELKLMVFPELHLHAYYGVGWKEDDTRQQKMQIAYEIEAMIRHVRWKMSDDPPTFVTSSSPPLHYSTEPLIKLEKVSQDEITPGDLYSAVMSIVEGATRGDLEKVRGQTNLLADKIEASGNKSTAERFRKAARGEFGARIIPMEQPE